MERRNAVIRLLASFVGIISGQQFSIAQEEPGKTSGTAKVTLTDSLGRLISPQQTITLGLVDESDRNSGGINKLTVYYQGRSITLTAKEIMEALENK